MGSITYIFIVFASFLAYFTFLNMFSFFLDEDTNDTICLEEKKLHLSNPSDDGYIPDSGESSDDNAGHFAESFNGVGGNNAKEVFYDKNNFFVTLYYHCYAKIREIVT